MKLSVKPKNAAKLYKQGKRVGRVMLAVDLLAHIKQMKTYFGFAVDMNELIEILEKEIEK